MSAGSSAVCSRRSRSRAGAAGTPRTVGSGSSGSRDSCSSRWQASRSPTGRFAGSHSEARGMLHPLVHLGVSPAEKAVRTVAVYVALLVLLHVTGKRQLAQLNSFDLVVLLLLSNVVQNAVIGNDNSLLGGLLGSVILLAVNYALVRGAFMSPRFGKAIQGGDTVLVQHGRLDESALRRQAITREELDAALRRQGVDGIDDVERLVLEPEGSLTPTKKPRPTLEDVLERLDRIERKLG